MTSQDDDPEARIRELEKPLSDAASATEIGQTQPYTQAQPYGYAPTPPPMPPPYVGGPPSTAQGGGFRAWGLVVAAVVVGVIALGAGIAIYTANKLSRVESTITGPSSRPGITHIPSSTPATSTRTSTAPGTSASTPAAPSGGTLTVSGVGKTENLVCNDNEVSVSGVSNTVTITGHCTNLTVSGLKNVVTIDATDSIGASGFDNKVTFHNGSPQVSTAGSGNVVQQG